jgi:hypothetical protein
MRISRRDMALAGAFTLGATNLLLATAAEAQSNEAETVGGAVEALRQAMLAADKAKLEALTHEKLSYGHSDGKVQDKADFIAVIVEKKTIYKSITLLEPTLAVAGDAAIVRHRFTGETEAAGKPGTPNILALQVWQKTGGNWKLLARQGFKT